MIHEIKINSPEELDSKRVKDEVTQLINEGAKTFEFNLRCDDFLPDNPKALWDKFKKIVSRAAFERDFN